MIAPNTPPPDDLFPDDPGGGGRGGYDPLDPQSDRFKPPAIPTEVHCLHCGQEYDSYLIEWRIETDHEGKPRGFWCCPVPGCDGKGFCFDIFPTDPDYRDEHGEKVWHTDDEGEDDDEEAEDAESDSWDITGDDNGRGGESGDHTERRPPHPPLSDDDIPW